MKFSPQLLCSVGIRQQSRATNLSLRPIRNSRNGAGSGVVSVVNLGLRPIRNSSLAYWAPGPL